MRQFPKVVQRVPRLCCLRCFWDSNHKPILDSTHQPCKVHILPPLAPSLFVLTHFLHSTEISCYLSSTSPPPNKQVTSLGMATPILPIFVTNSQQPAWAVGGAAAKPADWLSAVMPVDIDDAAIQHLAALEAAASGYGSPHSVSVDSEPDDDDFAAVAAFAVYSNAASNATTTSASASTISATRVAANDDKDWASPLRYTSSSDSVFSAASSQPQLLATTLQDATNALAAPQQSWKGSRQHTAKRSSFDEEEEQQQQQDELHVLHHNSAVASAEMHGVCPDAAARAAKLQRISATTARRRRQAPSHQRAAAVCGGAGGNAGAPDDARVVVHTPAATTSTTTTTAPTRRRRVVAKTSHTAVANGATLPCCGCQKVIPVTPPKGRSKRFVNPALQVVHEHEYSRDTCMRVCDACRKWLDRVHNRNNSTGAFTAKQQERLLKFENSPQWRKHGIRWAARSLKKCRYL